MKREAEDILVILGQERFEERRKNYRIVPVQLLPDDSEANALVNDIVNTPHAFVLACCMDRQLKSEYVWAIPQNICDELGGFSISTLAEKSEDYYLSVFNRLKLHRFNNTMASVFFGAVQDIVSKYEGDASRIWAGNPSSAAVVSRFLEFDGVGVKIATMGANILARDFQVPMRDFNSIDISPDVHVRRVMPRMGLVPDHPTNEQLIYKAREIWPEYPGIIDYPIWVIGQKYCHESNPKCVNCPANVSCDYCNK